MPLAALDPATHKRYLDYRERHAYFGRHVPLLAMADFVAADREQRELDAKGERRDDEDEERFAELCRLLFRD